MKMRAVMGVTCGAAALVVAAILFRGGSQEGLSGSTQDSPVTAERDHTAQPAPASEGGAALRGSTESGGLTPDDDSSALKNDEGEPGISPTPSTPPAYGQNAPVDDFFADALGTDDDGSGAERYMGSPRELQARMSRELRDETWAPHAERDLQDFLARQAHAGFYESVTVECRRTLCRILATGDGAVLASIPGTRNAIADWQEMLPNLRHDSAWQHFSADTVMFTTNKEHPGRVGIVTFLKRAGMREASST